ncbi:MAG: ABC transporter permease [Candidatus Uhrbacteria bacterium]|nr:ABC transporter permease [Candidatus Uhrbacteria bacterium]
MKFAIDRIAYFTIARKEIHRILRIWTQTLLPPVITQSLYFIIFGAFLGGRIGEMNGVPYMTFLVPGLVLMAMIVNAFSNVAGSFFGAKFQKSIEEIIVAPVSPSTILAGYCTGGIVRAVMVGAVIYGVSVFFVPPTITHVWAIVTFGLLTSIIFSLLGLLNGLYARKFDDVSIVPTFVLTPLTYLGGVFYELDRLPDAWQIVVRINPLAYMIDGFRYGFSGHADTPVALSAAVLVVLTVVLTIVAWQLLRRGMGMKT